MSIDLADVQGNILRGYRMPLARHFALAVDDAGRAGPWLQSVVAPEAPLRVTAASQWDARPTHTLNLGVTWAGLKALGVSPAVLGEFPEAFRRGPDAPSIARDLGDVGESDPVHWELGGPKQKTVHLLVSLHADEVGHLDGYSRTLNEQWAAAGLSVVAVRDGQALPDDKVHFGYRDGIAQPQVRGAPGRRVPDMQPDCEPGDFLLGCGYRNIYGGNYQDDLPSALVDNAAYGAFRILEQDVDRFEQLLQVTGRRWKMDPELVAAKLVGRWRNGVPLSLSPDSDQLAVTPDTINAFDYAPSERSPNNLDDRLGVRCPIGSHIRRLNPRSGSVMGMRNSRRIIRRAMPYGPAYDPSRPNDGRARGLVGYFICGDLEMQFEFIQQVWVNEDLSMCGIRGTREPLLGAHPDEGGKFTIRTQDTRDPIVIADLPRLITTRGSVYCLLPGLRGIAELGRIASSSAPVA